MADDRAELDKLRERIHALDRELVSLVDERRRAADRAAQGKARLDPAQEGKVVRRVAEIARELGSDEELVRDVIWRIIASARAEQEGRTHWGPPPAIGD